MVEGGGGGEKRKQGFLLPPPPASFLFLCSRPNVLDELARKRLLHRLNLNLMVVLSIACKTSKSLICMIQCRECKNIPDTPAKYIHWYVSFQARLDTGVIPGVFSVRKSCYLKSTPVKIRVREAADRRMWHLTCFGQCLWLDCHSADELQDDCQMSYDFAVFCTSCFTFGKCTLSLHIKQVYSVFRSYDRWQFDSYNVTLLNTVLGRVMHDQRVRFNFLRRLQLLRPI